MYSTMTFSFRLQPTEVLCTRKEIIAAYAERLVLTWHQMFIAYSLVPAPSDAKC